MAQCPFIDPKFSMPVDEPCPICGMLGFDWPNVADKCVGDERVSAVALQGVGGLMTLEEIESLVPVGWLWSLRKQATGGYLATVMKLGKPGQKVYEEIEQAERPSATEAMQAACAAASLVTSRQRNTPGEAS